jgi:hypothetical protein
MLREKDPRRRTGGLGDEAMNSRHLHHTPGPPPSASRRRPWRYRRCPSCLGVYAGGEFRPLRYGAQWREVGYGLRRCPGCGTVGQTRDFPVVRERRAGVRYD